MCRHGVACSAGRNRGRPFGALPASTRKLYFLPQDLNPVASRVTFASRHTVPPGPPWRSAPIYQIHGSAPRTRTRTRMHNNHAIRQRVASPSDRQMGDTEPNQDQERWKRNISTTRDETAHMLLITGRSTICSYVACKRLFLFCFSPSLFWTGADAISILTMSLTKIGHYSCLHHRVNTVSCLFNHITAERTSWFLSFYTCDIRYVSAQDADI